ncbi:MAG: glycogen debranching enzyme N-terminal domain-containing protein, partial [Holophagaceae bacterium]|nr:glycogen debranching enzyme N-terminal domain-containing protein [Holophagaceae bacterium]
PHIFERLGCRILHLLPLAPVPTTYARFGGLGSPYAALDLTAIDPALVEFDGRTTAEDQFRELADAVHARDGMLFLDLVANHTGWGSRLMEQHPDWFQREADGRFRSPGAWGVVWGDLVELKDDSLGYWEVLAEALLTWCRRGVDGYRCDAGYMVPLAAWQFVQAKVRREFPDTVFLLEGLGGAWEATETLLTDGGMQWAYSELFQNHSGDQVSGYLDHAFRQAGRVGPLVHYSETHDNPRLAARGARWALLRHRLCALASESGAFGYACGAEWLAEEKLDVHGLTSLAWGREPNLVADLGRLADLLARHPCFLDGAHLRRLSPEGSQILAFERCSSEGLDRCLVLANLAPDAAGSVRLPLGEAGWLEACGTDLLGQPPPGFAAGSQGVLVELGPGAVYCLAEGPEPRGLGGAAYRQRRALAAWACQQLAASFPVESWGPFDWRALGEWVGRNPEGFLGGLGSVEAVPLAKGLLDALERAAGSAAYPTIRIWEASDLRREVPVPPGHWVLFRDPGPFRISLRGGGHALHLRSIHADHGHIAALPPSEGRSVEVLEVELHRLGRDDRRHRGRIRCLATRPSAPAFAREGLVLLTNGRGAMARLQADLGRVASKYDCLLAANLDPERPCDRHVLAKRARVWVNVDGFLTALDGSNLLEIDPGPPARWSFLANAGDGRRVPLGLEADILQGRNAVRLRFDRGSGEADAPASVTLTVRLDLEDRSFHGETASSPDLDRHWNRSLHPHEDGRGFAFQPAPDRGLQVRCSAGSFHPEPEWCLGIEHPLERERGLRDRGDAWSPGWFEVSLPEGGSAELVLGTELQEPSEQLARASSVEGFGERLERALEVFLVARGEDRSIIAGYPWFLDWGRDAAVVARGLLAGRLAAKALPVLRTLGAAERDGSLPNQLGVEGDRVTSDAPLWFALACEEAAGVLGPGTWDTRLPGGRSLRDAVASIGRAHIHGTASGARLDPASGLVWSPARHTWMDTGFPACTPREGYPIELQFLWLRLLRQLARLGTPPVDEGWADLAARCEASLDLYWMEAEGWCADVLEGPAGRPASQATVDGRLRPNQLLGIGLGCLRGDRARRMVEAATRHLLVPGGLRSLAPLEHSGLPYAGRYAGDEDRQRKPAYHNGTAWVWWLPIYAEALAAAWGFEPAAVAAARAHLGDLAALLDTGCLGQLPELLDGDAPHTPRGCDAQAWSVSESLRVWRRLKAAGSR